MGLKKKKYLDIWTAEKTGLKDAAQLTRGHIDGYTEQRLRQTVKYAAANSSFYGDMFGDFLEAIDEAEKTGSGFMEIFERLPFTLPEDLRCDETGFLCVGSDKISRIVTLDTGGSTGKPKRVYFTEDDQQLTVDYFQNGMQLITDRSDKVLILMPSRVPGSIGRLLGQGLRNMGAEAIEYGLPGQKADEPKRLLRLMSEENVTCVVALPTHMSMLARELMENAGLYENVRIRSVLLSAEYIRKEDSELISRAFGCKVFEHYGMTEMGLGCAVGCGCGEGYHLREPDLYIEIIDPDTGRVIRDEQPGEIVFTTLTRKGMPFIRYRTGDHSHWINSPCGCGSIIKRMAKVGPRQEVKGYLK